MVQKVAVLLVHGMERSTTDNLTLDTSKKAMIEGLHQVFKAHVPDVEPEKALTFQMALWPIQSGLQIKSLDFIETMMNSGINIGVLRQLVLQLLLMGVSYQFGAQEREIYESVHTVFARTLNTLAHAAGEKAPLVIVAHSIGCVMIANYLYDIQEHTDDHPRIPASVQKHIRDTPLEKAETLTHLFTLGSPQAMWAMRLNQFGVPVTVPAPQLASHYPKIKGQWTNLYDKDDVLSYPLQPLNNEYDRIVKDVEVNVGGLLSSWNPASHLEYWTDKHVLERVGTALADVWRGAQK